MKPKLSIEHRVDALLEHGIEAPKRWAAVHGYVEPDNYDKFDQDGHFNEVCFNTLREHHLEETSFLFSMLSAMRDRILALEKRNEELERRPQPGPYDDSIYGPKIW